MVGEVLAVVLVTVEVIGSIAMWRWLMKNSNKKDLTLEAFMIFAISLFWTIIILDKLLGERWADL